MPEMPTRELIGHLRRMATPTTDIAADRLELAEQIIAIHAEPHGIRSAYLDVYSPKA